MSTRVFLLSASISRVPQGRGYSNELICRQRAQARPFRFQLVGSHVKGKGEDAMAVAFVHVPLLLLAGLLGRLRDNEIRFCTKLAFKIEQSYPDLGDFTSTVG